MRNRYRILFLALCIISLSAIAGCGKKASEAAVSDTVDKTVSEDTKDEELPRESSQDDTEVYTEGTGDTIDATVEPAVSAKEQAEEEEAKRREEEEAKRIAKELADEQERQKALEEQEAKKKNVDLIFFMGQSNMSGCGGDASLAPKVAEDAGAEFRAVSDPTRLYPIAEPFGANENNINGLIDRPGAKKGSLVSAFVNKYYKETGRKCICVSASRGETSIEQWLSEGIHADVTARVVTSKQWLTENGYTIGHMYTVWLQGESDGLAKTDPQVYRSKLDDFIRPLFINGMEKVFIITPGRTIDETEVYTQIANVQKQVCMESGYYALATSVLSGVSTEYMTDIYHYNQHVLNMVGTEAARAVAYYTNTGHEPVVYDYKEQKLIVPSGSEDCLKDAIEKIDLSNINNDY